MVQPVDEQTAQEIAGLLDTATLFYDMSSLINPPGGNAAELYRRVLDLQPGNPDAIQGLDTILSELLESIESLLSEGQAAEAREQIDMALHYFPDSEELLQLQEDAG